MSGLLGLRGATMAADQTFAVDAEVRLVPLERIRLPAGAAAYSPSPVEVETFVRAMAASGGVQHPLLVRPVNDREVELVAGRLRYEGCRSAGESVVPCRVRSLTDKQTAAVALLEDLAGKREPLLVRGWQIQATLEVTGWRQSDLSRMTLRSEAEISECLRAARALPPPLVEEVARQAELEPRTLAGLPRQVIRRIRTLPGEGERRSALKQVAEELKQGGAAPSLAVSQPLANQVIRGAVRLDLPRIEELRVLEFVILLAQVSWTLLKVRVSASPKFAGLRRAKSGAELRMSGPGGGEGERTSTRPADLSTT